MEYVVLMVVDVRIGKREARETLASLNCIAQRHMFRGCSFHGSATSRATKCGGCCGCKACLVHLTPVMLRAKNVPFRSWMLRVNPDSASVRLMGISVRRLGPSRAKLSWGSVFSTTFKRGGAGGRRREAREPPHILTGSIDTWCPRREYLSNM